MAAVFAGAQSAAAAVIDVPCTGTGGGAAGLVSAVTTANGNGQADTINIGAPGAPCAFAYTAAADTTAGGQALPIITTPIVINGNGSTLTRTAGSFRLIYVSVAVPVTLNDLSLVGGNVAAGQVGGDFASVNGVIALNNVTISNGTATSGGGIYQLGGSLAIDRSRITGSTANGANPNGGGAIYANTLTSLTIDHTTISSNTATNAAGAIMEFNTPLTVQHSAFIGNSSSNTVGSVWAVGGTSTFENDTFSGNKANNGLAGITVSNNTTTTGTANVRSTTFADSGFTAAGSTTPGSAVATFLTSVGQGGANLVLTNSIITDTDSTATTTTAPPCWLINGGTITTTGSNIEYPTTTAACGASTIHANPLLAPIALNGGTTQNFRLLPTSPALNGGGIACPATDQRDKPRPVFVSCDIGSFEVQAPDTAGTGPSGLTNSTTTTFTGTAEGTLAFECSTDAAPTFTACTSPFQPTLADGAHTISVRAIDTAYGTTDASPLSFSFTLDKTNPVVTITNPPSSPTNNTSPSLDFTVSDASAITSTTCKLDTGPATPCSSPYSTGPLADGSHTVLITATDAAGNAGTASTTFTVAADPGTTNVSCGDVTALRNAITAANATLALDTINVIGGPCTFTLPNSVDATDGGNGLPIVIHPLRINGGGATIARSLGNSAPFFRIMNVKNTVDPAVSLELHDMTLSGGLVAGSGGGLSATGAAVTIDNVTFVDSATGLGGGLFATGGSLNVDHSTFAFSAAAAGGGLGTVSVPGMVVQRSLFYANSATNNSAAVIQEGGTSTFRNDTFYANAATTTNPSGGLVLLSLATDPSTANVQSSTFSDNGGASSTPGSSIFPVSAANSVATVNLRDSIVHRSSGNTGGTQQPCTTNAAAGTTPASVINDQGGNIEFPTSSCGAGVLHADPKIAVPAANGGPTLTMLPAPTSPVIDHASGAPTCPATDQRNVVRPDGDGCDTGAVETNAPETTATQTGGDPTNHPTITMTSDQTPQLFQCKVDAAATFTTCTSPFTPTLSNGQHTVQVRAIDGSGYFDPSPASVTFTVDTTAPVVTITNKPPAVTPDNNPALNFTVNDGNATVTCQIDPGPAAPCSSPYQPGPLSDGSHTLRVFATDAAGNVGQDFATFTVDTAPPQTLNVPCGDVTALRAAITTANGTLAKDTIEVTGGPCTFTLNDSVDPTSGGNGLPIVIHPLVINGHGATIARNTAAGTPQFRIMFAWNSVDAAMSLELNNLSLNSGTLTTATPSSVNVGAGLVSLGSATKLDHVNMIGDVALQGGAIWTAGGTLDIDHSGLFFNTAVIAGAIQTNATPITVKRSSISLNSATSSVGAVEQIGSTGLYENDTFGANQAPNGVAGLAVTNSGATAGTATVRSSSLVDSTRSSSPANPAPASALLTFQNTGAGTQHIDVENTVVSDTDSTASPVQFKPCDTSLGGTITNLGGNVEYPGDTCGFGTHGVDPQLNAFSFATFSYLPKPTSPLIDHAITADCPATDQLDKARPDGDGCDVGSIETVAPETTLTGPPTDPTNDPTFTFTSDETPQLFVCRLDGGPNFSCASPLTLGASVPDGQHTLTVQAYTSTFYVDPSPASVTFTLDRTAPVVHITNKPAAITADNNPSLTFTVDDPNATVTCQLDSAPVVSPCTSPFAPGPLPDGTHTITVRATDSVGNTGSDSATFKVDTVPSQTFSVGCGDVVALRAAITAANATLAKDTIDVTGGPCTFTLNDSVDATAGGNGLPIVLHPLVINGHGSTITRNAASGTPTFRILFAYNQIDPNVSLELHDLTIARGALASPNVGAGIAGLGAGIKLDNVIVIGNVAAQGGGIWTSGGSLDIDHSTLSFNQAVIAGGLETANTPTTVRRSTFAINIATSSVGAAFIQGSTSTFENDTFASNGAGNGLGGLTVANAGAANGTATVQSSTFADNATTGNTAPGGSIWTFTAAGGGLPTIHVADTIVSDTDSTATPTVAPCSGTIVDDGHNMEYPGNTCGFSTHGVNPKLAPLANNGGPTATYRLLPGSPAIDAGANCPATDQRDFPRPDGDGCDIGSYEVDLPQTTATGPPSPTSNPAVSFTSDQANSTFECSVDGGPWTPCSSPFTPAFATNGSADGQHTVAVRATNPAGYVDPSPASVTFTYIAPIDTTITSGPTGGATIYYTTATYTFTASKSPATFECRLDAAPFAPCTSPKTVGGYAEGTHTFQVRAIDQFGNVDPTPASATFKYHHCLLLRIDLNGTTICLI